MITDIDIEKAIRKVAIRYGQSPAQVRRNMKAMLNESHASTDKQHVEAWALIPHEGAEPTLEDVFRYLSARLEDRK